jgi:hypothetical protein
MAMRSIAALVCSYYSYRYATLPGRALRHSIT